MRKRNSTPPNRAPAPRRMFVSDDDLAAAERLLALIAASRGPGGEEPERGRQAGERAVARANAGLALALRQRRVRLFGENFSADAPFTLMLAIYVHEEREPVITYSRLVQLAWLSSATTARWLQLLAEHGWVERKGDAADQRKTLLSLSAKARHAMDTLFSWPDQQPDAG